MRQVVSLTALVLCEVGSLYRLEASDLTLISKSCRVVI